MEPLDFGDMPEDALVLIDTAPIIYFLEGHPKFGPRSRSSMPMELGACGSP